ncbi:vitamin K epoxide reductase complex subunit 1-like protein 1 [Mytilus galloprovincialis]|uniref:vitamin K epoxide reductase complex subunit 1-like protein 1 n=1 Tax=Mytilus edulis TaxID=6550 RepID=UPI0039EE7029
MANEAIQLRKSARLFGNVLLIFCTVGMLLSVYALYVEIHAEGDSSFKAWCDINPKMSCSKVFTSKYGKGFGLLEYIVGKTSVLNQPNSIFGMMFYILQIICAMTVSGSLASFALGTSIVANFGSAYLAYILVYILDDVCVVCVSTYIVNAVILYCCYQRYYKIVNIVNIAKSKKQK